MKTKFSVVALLLVVICAPVFPADSATPAPTGPRVEVIYVNPEKFMDVKESYMGSERERDSILSLLKDYLVERAEKMIPEGHKLAITITDIDMAGDFEPQHGPQFNDVRIVKAIYPPRVDLSFKLTDASGAVVKEGQQKLRDLNFQMTSTAPAFNSDMLRYEKAMLDNWLRSEFPKAKASKEKK